MTEIITQPANPRYSWVSVHQVINVTVLRLAAVMAPSYGEMKQYAA